MLLGGTFRGFLGGPKGAEICPEIEHQFGAKFLIIRRPLGVVLGSILGSFGGAISGSRARDAKLAKIAPRHSESTIFGVPRGPKKDQTWLRNQLPAATWLQERLGGLWGSILVHFGVHFEVPNRSKNDTENKLIFKRFWAPLEISESAPPW